VRAVTGIRESSGRYLYGEVKIISLWLSNLGSEFDIDSHISDN
jgi:hypothetical protein